MQYLVQFNLDDGLEFLSARSYKPSPVIRLFKKYHSRGYEFRCWCCGLLANGFMACEKDGREEMHLCHIDSSGITQFTRDHIVPVSVGGLNDSCNYRPACTYCNTKRGNKMTREEILFAQHEYGIYHFKKCKGSQANVQIVQEHNYRLPKQEIKVQINLSWQEVYAKIAAHTRKYIDV